MDSLAEVYLVTLETDLIEDELFDLLMIYVQWVYLEKKIENQIFDSGILSRLP